MTFIIGQRWLSEAETDLGLGLVQDVDFRSVTVYFPNIDDVRTYSISSAPLSRVVFRVEDQLPLLDGSLLTITEVDEHDGIMFYGDGDRIISEIQISGSIQLNQPTDRLFSGQLDHNNLYELRQKALSQKAKLAQRPYFGLLGARTSLLAHQLYIAQQLTQDTLPRALLADEVGLGKTIEAGLVMHRLLLQERISRILILVPDHLVHQWLVEMIRRFNLRFSVITQEFIDEGGSFDENQLYLCPVSYVEQDDLSERLVTATWDMLVVDEAHHLTWCEDFGGDLAYCAVEDLAAVTPSMLLLTATPEQLGQEGHFARLRLLDPARYPSLQQFVDEQSAYEPIAQLAQALADETPLPLQAQQLLDDILPDLTDSDDNARRLDALIDRRGPGRALYRNSRHGVSGFPERITQPVTLPVPEQYLAEDEFPERNHENWCDFDPRVSWLLDLIKSTGRRKLVLICHHASTVLELEQYLWQQHGIQVAVFHEQMDLVERDRAAAYFADQDQGAKLLLCSEIGSEGRNFQFASDLVLFDLPRNCDLIEQRIGRLDRIGQKNDIQIHIPVFAKHASQRWFDVLDTGLDVFSKPNPAAQSLFQDMQPQIMQLVNSAITDESLNEQLDTIATRRKAVIERLEAGRDRLLELHSCHPTNANELATRMAMAHIEDESELADFIEQFADAFGLELQDLGGECISITPGDHMLVPDLPHLPEDGFMATTQREIALARDDVQFLTWEHPFIDQALELITSGPAGNSSAGYIEQHGFATGDTILELQFAARCAAPRALGVERYLPPNAMHLRMYPNGDLKVNEDQLEQSVLPLKRGTARGLVDQKEQQLRPVIHRLESLGSKQLDKMIERALDKMNAAYSDRINRMKALAATNSHISMTVVNELEAQQIMVEQAIEQSQLVLDSVRLVFCN